MFTDEMKKLFQELDIKQNSKSWEDYEKAKKAYLELEVATPTHYYPRYNEFIDILTEFIGL